MNRKMNREMCVLVPRDQCQRASGRDEGMRISRVRQSVVLAWCSYLRGQGKGELPIIM